MYLLTQAIRQRLRKYGLFSQIHRDRPRLLVQMTTGPYGRVYGYGPWTWWVLGAREGVDDDWLFAGVMQDGERFDAGLFSIREILDLEFWRRDVYRILGTPLLPEGLIPIWRRIDPGKPIRIMEFTRSEITEAQDRKILECYTRPLDAFDLAWLAQDDADFDN